MIKKLRKLKQIKEQFFLIENPIHSSHKLAHLALLYVMKWRNLK